MEKERQPGAEWRKAKLMITVAMVLFVVSSCARIESGLPGARVADDGTAAVSFDDGPTALPGVEDPAAARAVNEAYAAAQRSKLWESMFEVGDGYSHIGDAPKARRCYLIAFYRARAEGSHDGVRRVAQALAMLGDHEMAARVEQQANKTRDRHPTDPSKVTQRDEATPPTLLAPDAIANLQ